MSSPLLDNDEEIFTILAHPLRRKILRSIFEDGSITFTIMSKEWKTATGTLYHHLKTLNGYILQDDQNRYLLTDKGRELAAWFTRQETGKVTVKKIDSFTILSRPIFDFVDTQRMNFLIGLGIVLVVALLRSETTEIWLCGPFIDQDYHILKNIFAPFVLLGSYFLVLKLMGSKDPVAIIIGLGLALTPGFVFLIIYSYITLILSITAFFILSVLLQFWYLSIMTAVLIYYENLKIERSILINVIILYVLQLVSFYF
ncbi:MAG: helix-turn-helix transcriptional regulator [Candidatus Heimdallarchaeota archaeon]|nr:helix-turn-helix transcriptional regulator [Candidatus Heimdallarchaeota archaeon]